MDFYEMERKLVEAVARGDAGRSDLLLALGANPNARAAGSSVIALALVTGNRKIFESLVEAGADLAERNHVGETLLHVAAKSGRDWAVSAVCERVSPDSPSRTSGRTALHDACSHGQPNVVTALLSAGADPSLRCPRGMTPAEHAAASHSSHESIETGMCVDLITAAQKRAVSQTVAQKPAVTVSRPTLVRSERLRGPSL